MKILVCGGAGYIGSHVAKAIRLAGHEPVVFDNLSAGHEWAVQWGPLVRGDLMDRVAIESVLISHQIEAVVQLAGSINVGESMKNPGKYFRNNFSISLNLLEAMDASGVNQIVFSSTASVYGIPATSPIDESAAKRPINPYGEAKWFVERLLDRYPAPPHLALLSATPRTPLSKPIWLACRAGHWRRPRGHRASLVSVPTR